jgi:hypothetical protein
VVGLLLILAGSWLSTDGRLPPGLGAVVARLRWRRGRPSADVGAMPLPREERIADPAAG